MGQSAEKKRGKQEELETLLSDPPLLFTFSNGKVAQDWESFMPLIF